jgi:hypothetical protein
MVVDWAWLCSSCQMVRDLGLFNSDEHRWLVEDSRRSHYLHEHACQLERALLQQMQGPHAPIPTGEEAQRMLHACLPPTPMPAGVALHLSEHFDAPFKCAKPIVPAGPLQLADVLRRSGVEHLPTTCVAEHDRALLAPFLAAQPDSLPALHGKPGRRQLQRLKDLLDGHDDTAGLLEPMEIVDRRSNVRLFTPPDRPAFGVQARRNIPAGTFTHSVSSLGLCFAFRGLDGLLPVLMSPCCCFLVLRRVVPARSQR